MENNIKEILEKKDLSIRQLAIGLKKPYAFTHDLVNRENLLTTQLGTLIEIAKFLEVEITELFSNK